MRSEVGFDDQVKALATARAAIRAEDERDRLAVEGETNSETKGQEMSKDADNPTAAEIADVLRGLDPNPNTLMRSFDVEFTRLRCVTCDIPFYIPEFWLQQRRRSGDSFYCPNGHGLNYSKPESEK